MCCAFVRRSLATWSPHPIPPVHALVSRSCLLPISCQGVTRFSVVVHARPGRTVNPSGPETSARASRVKSLYGDSREDIAAGIASRSCGIGGCQPSADTRPVFSLAGSYPSRRRHGTLERQAAVHSSLPTEVRNTTARNWTLAPCLTTRVQTPARWTTCVERPGAYHKRSHSRTVGDGGRGLPADLPLRCEPNLYPNKCRSQLGRCPESRKWHRIAGRCRRLRRYWRDGGSSR